MIYKILYAKEVVTKHIPKLSHEIRNIIKKNIESKLSRDPIIYGKPLQYSLKENRSLRIGDYRVIYEIKNNVVYINMIGHRKGVYE